MQRSLMNALREQQIDDLAVILFKAYVNYLRLCVSPLDSLELFRQLLDFPAQWFSRLSSFYSFMFPSGLSDFLTFFFLVFPWISKANCFICYAIATFFHVCFVLQNGINLLPLYKMNWNIFFNKVLKTFSLKLLQISFHIHHSFTKLNYVFCEFNKNGSMWILYCNFISNRNQPGDLVAHCALIMNLYVAGLLNHVVHGKSYCIQVLINIIQYFCIYIRYGIMGIV